MLTPQGDDAAKGILEFADGKPLGKSGVVYLQIHGADCYGLDKKPADERIQWVKDHTEEIMAVNNNPYGEASLEFWMAADEPFQFLAFCFDYAGYVRNGADWKSHLICHIDQTCSGLQHWSAVLHDEQGAAEVGMVKKDQPDDVYSRVADVVGQMVVEDADEMAKAWVGKVTRMITKRNVMTRLYGATAPGMRDQVKKELRDLDKKADTGRYLDTDVDNFQAAKYIARMNYLGMAEVVKKADEGMNYVQSVAELLADEGLAVKWTSPIGLPIVQTYWKTRTKSIKTYWVSLNVNHQHKDGRQGRQVQLNLSYPVPESGVQKKKASNSIAPNYIHSMDASHLLFVGLAWDHSFTPIHDSFGTHACDVAELHKVVRHGFVKMYEGKDYLDEFTAGIVEYYGKAVLGMPDRGSFDFNNVYESPYFCGAMVTPL
jgi:DNA-directed RNA polymerase